MSTDGPQTLRWWMDERRGELGLTWQQVADLADVSTETLYRAADGRRMRTTTRKGIERALQWQRGSVEAIAKGGSPTAQTGAAVGDRLETNPEPRAMPPVRAWTEVDERRFRLLEQLFESWGEEMTAAKVQAVLEELRHRLAVDGPQRTEKAGVQSDADGDRPPVRGTTK